AWSLGAYLLLPRDSVTYWTSAIFNSGRLGDNAGPENQSLRGLLLRFFLPGSAPGVLWLLIAVAVAVPGFLLARRLARQQWQIAGIAVTALLLVLVPPVAWIHYYLLVVIAIGALVGDGSRIRRVLTAAGTAVFFGLTVPWWGNSLLSDSSVPRTLSRLLEGSFGIAAVVLLVIIARTTMTEADREPAGGDGPAGPADGGGDVGSSPGLDRLSSV